MRIASSLFGLFVAVAGCQAPPPEDHPQAVQLDGALRKRLLEGLRSHEQGPHRKDVETFLELCRIVQIPSMGVSDEVRVRAAQWLLPVHDAVDVADNEHCRNALVAARALSGCHRVRAVLELVENVIYGVTPPWVAQLETGRVLDERDVAERDREDVARLLEQLQGAEKEVSTPEPMFFSLWTHWLRLSRPALVDWCRCHADTVVDANIATDLLWMRKDWKYVLTVDLWVSARGCIPDVRRLAETFSQCVRARGLPTPCDEPHFDDLFRHREFVAYWAALEDWIDAECRLVRLEHEVDEDRARRRFLCLVGVVHHAVQDFYCHSNYVELFRSVDPANTSPSIPTWRELHREGSAWSRANRDLRDRFLERLQQSNDGPPERRGRGFGGLQSGVWSRKIPARPWRHQHPSGVVRDDALAVALDATEAWTHHLSGKVEQLFALSPSGDDCRCVR